MATQVRANQIFGINGLPKPFIYNIFPVSAVPNSSASITIKGAYFTPDMEVLIQNQIVNSVNFISSNEIIVGINTSATEEQVNIILNNGNSYMLENAITISVGTVTVPTFQDYYNISGNINIQTQGEAKPININSGGSAEFFDFPLNGNYALEWKWFNSPLFSSAPSPSVRNMRWIDKVTGEEKLALTVANSGYWTEFFHNNVSQKRSSGGAGKIIRLERIDGTIYFKFDNSLQFTLSGANFPNPLKLQVNVRYRDIKGIRLIELL